MNRQKILLIFLLSIVLFCASCTQVAITGRKQVNFVPDSMVSSMAASQYSSFMKENEVSTDPEKTALVKETGRRIARAVETYFRNRGQSDRLSEFEWEFNLIEDEAKNAWAMPGGKVVIYTGILPITKDENGLAVVMSHEIAHILARHGNERMSQGLLFEMGGMALAQAVKSKPAATQDLFMRSYGIGGQLGVLLPYSRIQESEADRLGLIFMSIAGYNPATAIDFWQRMSESKEGGGPPELLSTHPSDKTRIAQIQQYLPEAMKYYNNPNYSPYQGYNYYQPQRKVN